MTFSYRRPRDDEAVAMAALHVQCWREAYRGIVPAAILDAVDMAEREAAWRKHLADPGLFACTAVAAAGPVGFVLAGRNNDPGLPSADGQIAAIYVLARCHRQGIGRRLMAETAGWWRRQGGQALALRVLADNAVARAFYEKLGGRLIRTSTYEWHGHALADAAYIFESLDILTGDA